MKKKLQNLTLAGLLLSAGAIIAAANYNDDRLTFDDKRKAEINWLNSFRALSDQDKEEFKQILERAENDNDLYATHAKIRSRIFQRHLD